jgi:hypothetical protein
LSVIYQGDTPVHGDAFFGTVFDAEFTFNAAPFTGLYHHLFNDIPVGTKGHGAPLILRNPLEERLGTFVKTEPAPGTFSVVHPWQSVIAHAEGAEPADLNAVTESKAAPGAELGSSGGKLGAPAALEPGVSSFEGGVLPGTLAGQYRYKLRHAAPGNSHKGGDFFRCGRSSHGTVVYPGASRRYSGGVIIAARKTAGSAVRSGQNFPDLARQGILGYGEDFPEKAQGGSQRKGKDQGKHGG